MLTNKHRNYEFKPKILFTIINYTSFLLFTIVKIKMFTFVN